MDLKDTLKQLSDRAEKLKDNLQTEEATKNALIMPFIQAIGYDVFNPIEVVPEYTCDIGTKKGEKIDYAIMKDGYPIMLIECKHCEKDLTLLDNQLLRYFHVSTAKFGILTNGIKYKFYTDLETQNKMDEKPFLEIDILDLKDNHIDELKKFHKSYFDVENIMNSASGLKYTNELRRIIGEEFQNPSADFVKMFAKQVYVGPITAKVLDQFTILLKRSIQNHISDLISEKIKVAFSNENADNIEKAESESAGDEIKDTGIVTGVEELEGFMIVKSILRQHIDIQRVLYKDTHTYLGILLDNTKKTICRLYFNGKKKFITTLSEEKKEIRFDIESLDDIYKFSDEIIISMKKYLTE